MDTDLNFSEEHLQLSWCRIQPDITTVGGEAVTLYSRGIWNLEAGPDFMNAKIAIDGEICKGDIEVHRKTSDWIHHGHTGDPRYDNVILHVVAEDDSGTLSEKVKQRLPEIPVAVITPLPVTGITAADKFPEGKCYSFFSLLEDAEINLFFRKAGMRRFNLKVSDFLDKMHDRGINRAFTGYLFDALGYKKNRKNFQELFMRISDYENLTDKEMEAVIWGESGLLPDPASVKLDPEMREAVTSLWNIWWRIRREPKPDIKWNRSGLRPMNSPERRIAAATQLVSRMGESPLMFFADLAENRLSPDKTSTPADFAKRIIQNIKCSHPLWDRYINFTHRASASASVLGGARAADICINIILPALKAYAILTDRHDNSASNIPETAFLSMPSTQSNRILETAALKWFAPPGRKRNIVKDAASQQGVLYIYREFCEELCGECDMCPLAHMINEK